MSPRLRIKCSRNPFELLPCKPFKIAPSCRPGVSFSGSFIALFVKAHLKDACLALMRFLASRFLSQEESVYACL